MHSVSKTIRSASAPCSHSNRRNCVRALPQLVLLSVAALLYAATSSAQVVSTNESSQAAAAASPPAPAAPSLSSVAISAPSGYVLQPNDQVAVEVFGEDDLRTNGRLNAEGNLSLPLLGSVRLSGLTLSQATSRVTELYGRDYLVNPKVNVMLVGYAKRRFTVLGQVNRPGSYEMPDGSPGGVDLLEAIAMAGGYTRIAAPERISIRRQNASGGDQIIKVDAKRLTRKAGGGFIVRPGDTVTVAESIF
jgi:protein involved in polysaccharide export with SLBB domain